MKVYQDEDFQRMVGVPGRDFSVLGGAFDGAARFERQIANWNPGIRSADAEILPDKSLLDARARDLTRNDAYVHWGTQQHRDSIVGSFFLLNAKPAHEVLGRSADWAEEFQREVEAKFTLWAESPHHWVDASQEQTMTEMVRLIVGLVVMNGEALATAEWMPKSGREFRTAIQIVDTDRLSTPFKYQHDPDVRGGIRRDRYGRRTMAYIRARHPQDFGLYSESLPNWREVPFEKPWGRQMVFLFREKVRPEQTRAISDLTSSMREVAITRKFRDVTLQNAVLNASYAATIESELPTEILAAQIGVTGQWDAALEAYASSFLGQIAAYSSGAKNLMLDGAKIPHLYPGTRLQLRPAGTPGGVGQDFEKAMLRYLAASLGVSYEELTRDYTQTNYSSARAAMMATWRFMQSRKRIVADSFANAVYRLWIEEAINNDKIESFRASEAAQLYTDGHQNQMFDALTRAEWIGAARGQIDELKETQAAVLRIKYGLSTHEDELARLGKDWRRVYEQMEREQKEREKRGISLTEDDKMMNAVTGSPREDRQGGEAGEQEPDAD
jgi:lambda family phage portal protein